MNSRPRSSFVASPFVALALLLTAATGSGQTVGSFVHAKIQNYRQTSSSAPILDAAQPYQFGSLVTRGTATIDSATLTFPGSASPRTYTSAAGGNTFTILDTFTTQAQLDAAYGTGNYNLTVNTSAGVLSRSTTLLFAFFQYPTIPRLTVPTTDWQNDVLVIDSSVDYTFTWSPLVNPQANDLIQFVIREVINPPPFPGTQTSFVLPAGTLQPGTEYAADLAFGRGVGVSAADADFGQGIGALVRSTAFTIRTLAPALALTSAVSRKEHGIGGPVFDIDLPLSGTPGVEPRTGGASAAHAIVFTFSNPITSGEATVTSGTGTVAGAPVITDNTMTVVLNGVANAQTTTITLSNVTDSFAQVLPDTAVAAGFLLGDVNGSRSVSATDIGQVKSQSGQAVSASNFRADVTASGGSINASDIGLVKSASGTTLPP